MASMQHVEEARRCKYLHFIITVLVFQLLASDGINLSDAAAGLEPESRIEM